MHHRDLDHRLRRHQAFWDRAATDRPLVGFRIEKNYLLANWMKSTSRLLTRRGTIVPNDIDIDAALPEYEQLFSIYEQSGQDFFWSAEPFPGIPWMEAMMGGIVTAGQDSFVVSPGPIDPEDPEFGVLDADNPWYRTYIDFITKLDTCSNGRFGVGQPILRGPLDTLCSLLTVQEAVYACYDKPEWVAERLARLSESFTRLVASHQSSVSPFLGGSTCGFYHLWCPGRLVWLQEDASAFLSPTLYRDFQAANDQSIIASQPFSLFHLHPASFFIIDALLAMPELDVVQVNRDVNGPGIAEMLPVLQKIMAADKRLYIWGKLTVDELTLLLDSLPSRGLALQLFVHSAEEGQQLMDEFFPAT